MNDSITATRAEQAAAFGELTRKRRSVRGFLPDQLDQATLDSIFASANYAPSNANTQPWQAYVASGAMRDRLSQRLLETIG